MTAEAPLRVAERLSTGMVSVVVAVLMAAVVAIAAALRVPAYEGPDFWEHFLVISGAICLGAGVVGFVAGPVRMAHYFGVLWGTSKPTTTQMAVIVTVVLLICAVALFGWPTW
jgi:hypothetical protein